MKIAALNRLRTTLTSSEKMMKERWLNLLSDYWHALLLLHSAKGSSTLRSFITKGGLKISISFFFTHTLSSLFSVKLF